MNRALKSVSVALLVAVSILLACPAWAADEAEKTIPGRWTEDKVNAWYARQPWPVGCNYVPSTAVNQIETWQAETFDPDTIDRELALAQGIGFNTVRIFSHDLVWEANPEAFKKRIDQFLALCEKHDILVIFTFFTNGCYYNLEEGPHLGKQPESVPGIHNPGWVQSPGCENVNDPAKWGRLEAYVKDMLSSFREDKRIMVWDLYNEPGNPAHGRCQSLPLLREVFKWGRAIDPSQPLTACLEWRTPEEMVEFILKNSDVISFHSYAGPKTLSKKWPPLAKKYNRPLFCTEYMARPRGSTFQAILPIFHRERIAAISFGLVNGKINTQFPWKSEKGSPEPNVWFHDIFRPDGTPFDQEEIDLIRKLSSSAE